MYLKPNQPNEKDNQKFNPNNNKNNGNHHQPVAMMPGRLRIIIYFSTVVDRRYVLLTHILPTYLPTVHLVCIDKLKMEEHSFSGLAWPIPMIFESDYL